MMIAVAVAMSVIIFVWSQGFLSQTSSAAGSQQAVQNQAAQSSIAVESVSFIPAASGGNCNTAPNCKLVAVIRNVGAVSINFGTVSITGITSNSGFKGNVVIAAAGSSVALSGAATTSSSGTWTVSSDVATNGVAKSAAVTLTFTSTTSNADTNLLSGDVVSVKVTTGVGTFASGQFTIP